MAYRQIRVDLAIRVLCGCEVTKPEKKRVATMRDAIMGLFKLPKLKPVLASPFPPHFSQTNSNQLDRRQGLVTISDAVLGLLKLPKLKPVLASHFPLHV
jgi:hypothetical protein